jgi:hypothetical protein
VQAERPNANAAITQGTIRVIIAPQAVNRVDPTNDNGYIAPFLSMNPAMGLENLFEPVRGGLVETVRVGSPSPAGQKSVYGPRMSGLIGKVRMRGETDNS